MTGIANAQRRRSSKTANVEIFAEETAGKQAAAQSLPSIFIVNCK